MSGFYGNSSEEQRAEREKRVLASLICPDTATTAAQTAKECGLETSHFSNLEWRDNFDVFRQQGADVFGGNLRQEPAGNLAIRNPDELEAAMRCIIGDASGLPQPKRLADFPKPTPDKENPSALLCDRFLRKGGGLVIVAPSGVGKSTFATGATSYWAAGREFCGIRPARPLKIGVFQTEDDDEEMGEFRDNLHRGMADANFTREEIKLALSVNYEPVPPTSGDKFCEHLQKVQNERHYDMIVLNPLWAFVGGDMTKNADLGAFLRHGIDPLLKHAELGCGMVIIHHTNKLKTDNRGRIDLGATDAYAGAGGAELTNWARAVMVLQEINQATPREFFLVAAKRGTRLNWTDGDGKPTTRRKLSHSTSGIFWIDCGGIAAPKDKKTEEEKKAEQSMANTKEREAFFTAALDVATKAGDNLLDADTFKRRLIETPGGAIAKSTRSEKFVQRWNEAKAPGGILRAQHKLERKPDGTVGNTKVRTILVSTPDRIAKYCDKFNSLGL